MRKNKNLKRTKRLIRIVLMNIGAFITAKLAITLMISGIIIAMVLTPLAYFTVFKDLKTDKENGCTCTFLTQKQIDALEKGATNGVANGGSNTAGNGTGDGSVNIPDSVLISADGLVVPNSNGAVLTGIDNPYGFPLYNGYTMSTPGSEVIVPYSTDNRVEGKVAQKPGYTTYAPDTMTIAERAKRNVVSTEFTRDKLYVQDGRLGVALGAGAIAWPDDPDHSASMLGVKADIVFKDGTVLPIIMKDAKANIHTGNINKVYVGGAGAHPDYSIIELYWGIKKGSNDYVTQTWLSNYGSKAGGIDHVKVYNHKNVSYAISIGNYDASTVLTGGNAGNNTNTGTNTGNTLAFNYSSENLDGGEVKAEYTINSCEPLVIKSMPVTLTDGYPKDSVTANGAVVHFNAGPSSIDGIHNWFNGSNTSSHFQVDNTGAVAQYLPLNQYALCSNSENGKKIGIEVANKSMTDAEYTEAGYKSLVHLVAYLAYELNYDLDFSFTDNKAGNKYWDTGTIMRHYDTIKGSEQYAKACPAYYVPNDGSISNGEKSVIEYLNNAGAGGNTRWISFKVAVSDYILKYKNDPNFAVKLEDGSELLGMDWARANTTGKFDWKNANQSSIGNTPSVNNGTNHNYTTSCHMATDGYCGCYIRDPNCTCGCKSSGSSQPVQENGNGGTTDSGSIPYSSDNGLPIPATRQYTMDDVKSTGPQRVLDSAMVTFQGMYKLGSHNLGKVPLYTWNTKGSGYNYTGLAQVGYKTADGLTTSGKWDCSSYVCAVLNNMGISKYHQQSTATLINMDLTEFGFTRIAFSKEALQPGDIVVKAGHTEIFAGWVDGSHKQSYVWSWGGSERKSNYNDGKGFRGLGHNESYGISGYPGANNNGVDSLITGPQIITQGNYTVIYRYTGK